MPSTFKRIRLSHKKLARQKCLFFPSAKTRKRIFVSTMAVLTLKDFLEEQGLTVNEGEAYCDNFYLAESLDVADIKIGNAKIDTRCIVNNQYTQLWIPKKPFELGYTFDFYVAVSLDTTKDRAEIVGFVSYEDIKESIKTNPDKINYYILDASVLKSPLELASAIIPVSKIKKQESQFTEADHNVIQELFTAYIDDDISFKAKTFFEHHISNCDKCREELFYLYFFNNKIRSTTNIAVFIDESIPVESAFVIKEPSQFIEEQQLEDDEYTAVIEEFDDDVEEIPITEQIKPLPTIREVTITEKPLPTPKEITETEQTVPTQDIQIPADNKIAETIIEETPTVEEEANIGTDPFRNKVEEVPYDTIETGQEIDIQPEKSFIEEMPEIAIDTSWESSYNQPDELDDPFGIQSYSSKDVFAAEPEDIWQQFPTEGDMWHENLAEPESTTDTPIASSGATLESLEEEHFKTFEDPNIPLIDIDKPDIISMPPSEGSFSYVGPVEEKIVPTEEEFIPIEEDLIPIEEEFIPIEEELIPSTEPVYYEEPTITYHEPETYAVEESYDIDSPQLLDSPEDTAEEFIQHEPTLEDLEKEFDSIASFDFDEMLPTPKHIESDLTPIQEFKVDDSYSPEYTPYTETPTELDNNLDQIDTTYDYKEPTQEPSSDLFEVPDALKQQIESTEVNEVITPKDSEDIDPILLKMKQALIKQKASAPPETTVPQEDDSLIQYEDYHKSDITISDDYQAINIDDAQYSAPSSSEIAELTQFVETTKKDVKKDKKKAIAKSRRPVIVPLLLVASLAAIGGTLIFGGQIIGPKLSNLTNDVKKYIASASPPPEASVKDTSTTTQPSVTETASQQNPAPEINESGNIPTLPEDTESTPKVNAPDEANQPAKVDQLLNNATTPAIDKESVSKPPQQNKLTTTEPIQEKKPPVEKTTITPKTPMPAGKIATDKKSALLQKQTERKKESIKITKESKELLAISKPATKLITTNVLDKNKYTDLQSDRTIAMEHQEGSSFLPPKSYKEPVSRNSDGFYDTSYSKNEPSIASGELRSQTVGSGTAPAKLQRPANNVIAGLSEKEESIKFKFNPNPSEIAVNEAVSTASVSWKPSTSKQISADLKSFINSATQRAKSFINSELKTDKISGKFGTTVILVKINNSTNSIVSAIASSSGSSRVDNLILNAVRKSFSRNSLPASSTSSDSVEIKLTIAL